MRPSGIVIDDEKKNVYVAELDYRVSIMNFSGEVLARFGQGRSGTAKKLFNGFAHGIAVNSKGDIYIAETMVERSVLKFERV